MPAATITPLINIPTTALAEIAGSTVPNGEEHSLAVRASNITGADVLVRLAIGPSADSNAAGWRAFDLRVPANDARDFEEKLTLPAGWRLFSRASTNAAVHLTITGRKRATA